MLFQVHDGNAEFLVQQTELRVNAAATNADHEDTWRRHFQYFMVVVARDVLLEEIKLIGAIKTVATMLDIKFELFLALNHPLLLFQGDWTIVSEIRRGDVAELPFGGVSGHSHVGFFVRFQDERINGQLNSLEDLLFVPCNRYVADIVFALELLDDLQDVLGSLELLLDGEGVASLLQSLGEDGSRHDFLFAFGDGVGQTQNFVENEAGFF
jgi:hypothetical protein